MKRSVATILVLLGTVSVASATTPRTKYVRAVSKFASAPGAKPKGLCVCQNGLDQGQVGYLRSVPGGFNALVVSCAIPGFSAAGEIVGGTSCTTFVPLGK